MDAILDHERLDVYHVALEFLPLALSLIPRQGERNLLDQVERAAESIVLNIAEGAGRHSRPDKRRFYEMAKGSAMECASIIDILRVKGIGAVEDHAKARELNVRLIRMLSKLCGVAGRDAAKDRAGNGSRGGRITDSRDTGPVSRARESGHADGEGQGEGR